MTTGPLDVLRLLARDSSCHGIMGFGAFDPHQIPVSQKKTYLTSIAGVPSPRRASLVEPYDYLSIPATCSAC